MEYDEKNYQVNGIDILWAFLVVQQVKNLSANAEDTGLIPQSGRYPGEGNGNPFQYSCLGNPMDKGAWQGVSPWGHKRIRHDLATKITTTDIFLASNSFFQA